MNKRIILDVDGVCLNFGQHFIDHCKPLGINLSIGKVWNFFLEDERSIDVFNNLTDDFWLNIPREPKSFDLDSVPLAYISHRTCSEEVTRQSLLNAGFPDAPVIHVKYTEDKIKEFHKLNGDIFVDDRASTVAYFLENGIEAYTLDQTWNEDFNIPRIYTLGGLN